MGGQRPAGTLAPGHIAPSELRRAVGATMAMCKGMRLRPAPAGRKCTPCATRHVSRDGTGEARLAPRSLCGWAGGSRQNACASLGNTVRARGAICASALPISRAIGPGAGSRRDARRRSMDRRNAGRQHRAVAVHVEFLQRDDVCFSRRPCQAVRLTYAIGELRSGTFDMVRVDLAMLNRASCPL